MSSKTLSAELLPTTVTASVPLRGRRGIGGESEGAGAVDAFGGRNCAVAAAAAGGSGSSSGCGGWSVACGG
eukprot:986933-Pleurochrysis_carterae.AAC.2